MIELRVVAEGILLPVRAQSGARRNAVRGVQAGRLRVSVTQVAEKGKANAAIAAVLAEALGIRASHVALATGATSTAKQFLIRGLSEDELRRRIAKISAEGEGP